MESIEKEVKESLKSAKGRMEDKKEEEEVVAKSDVTNDEWTVHDIRRGEREPTQNLNFQSLF